MNIKLNPPWKGLPIEVQFKEKGWRFYQEAISTASEYLVRQPIYAFEKDEEYVRVVEITPALIRKLETEGMDYNKVNLTKLGLTSGWLVMMDEVGSDGSFISRVTSAPSLEQALSKAVEVVAKYNNLKEAYRGVEWKNPTYYF